MSEDTQLSCKPQLFFKRVKERIGKGIDAGNTKNDRTMEVESTARGGIYPTSPHPQRNTTTATLVVSR